ncbi:hypothetical protein OJF2_48270 [Aquisphaera giovannonii]|uniref:DUF4013 domain-containing protein n=1 Tax=Aquisphaera giovannonii TaxID=406548 RepID=A0A5B9W7E3_9BACT|nr:hypothetical protein [Aquisphaera giovannonii]QEH36267.1 hypothetical protein OJF2_48270 [Aquisphaera giovannonii]
MEESPPRAGFGYDLQPGGGAEPVRGQSGARRREGSPGEARAGRRAEAKALDRSPITDGFLKPLQAPERSLFTALLYPLRSADSLGIAAAIGAAYWMLVALVFEYCLVIQSDAESFNAGPMGWLVNLITAMPSVFLLPLVTIYLLQYLGRVIVSSGRGETVPPKTPDRNFDGFFDGLSRWFIWLALGVVPGFLPLALSASAGVGHGGMAIARVVVLAAAGVSYASVALMRTFLDDNPLAGNPFGVLGAVLGHGPAIVPAAFRVLVLLAGTCGLIAMLVALRAMAFWIYIPAALPACSAVVWALIVAARVLGLGYYHNRHSLGWQAPPARARRRDRPKQAEHEGPLAGADI